MTTESKVIAVIPARWGSTRFPGKPLALIKGKPMIQWVFEQTSKAKSVSEVIIATDDSRILEVANNFGGNAVMTSVNHGSGTDRIAEVIYNKKCEIVVNVQGDEPLIEPKDILTVLRARESDGETSLGGQHRGQPIPRPVVTRICWLERHSRIRHDVNP